MSVLSTPSFTFFIGGRYKKHDAFELYELIKKNLPLKLINVKTKGKFIYIEFEKSFYIILFIFILNLVISFTILPRENIFSNNLIQIIFIFIKIKILSMI